MKTHRERVRGAAWEILGPNLDPRNRAARDAVVATIARETFPTELVEAAKGMLERHHTQEQWDEAEDRLRSALEAYKETP